MKFPNRVRETRIQKGYSREKLAQMAGVTRQSIGLIEAGRVSPSTVIAIRLSRALGCPVEQLFFDEEGTIQATLVADANDTVLRGGSTRAFVSKVGDHFIARPASIDTVVSMSTPVHGIAERTESAGTQSARAQAHIRLLQPREALSKTAFISGCDVGLGLLANYSHKVSASNQGVWFNVPNRQALSELASGFTHVAAIHTAPSGQGATVAGLPFTYRQFYFASAELGWILAKGNPKGFRGVDDLQGDGLRLINRVAGAGARELLDTQITRCGLDANLIRGYDTIANGHLAVADLIANGVADVGIGHAGAAAAYGLTFLPLQQEVCSLVIPEQHLAAEPVQVLLEVLQSGVFRMELQSLGPYDVQKTGTVFF